MIIFPKWVFFVCVCVCGGGGGGWGEKNVFNGIVQEKLIPASTYKL